MNIKQAKEQIINTAVSYLSVDEYGRYEIPINKQRPIFLMGPPGIGKTEIMAQVAAELGIGLISYSMTHHTRQSALGLPLIKQKEYGGKIYDVSEYTMSEIIASVYDMIESTGIKNGLLFLDEINCVSETLTPVMLQFLQYKVFGVHKVPEGWIVVTAGNPPEYNSSVHEFDIVTWDRLKRIDVEPDLKVWKEFAYSAGVHAAVMTYLDVKPQNFYKTETTVDGKSFVTARGWDDLSRIIRQYEKHGLTVDRNVVGQYLQDEKIARDFAIYYDLFNKYRSDYRIDDILRGTAGADILQRASDARFDERYSLIGLLLDAVGNAARSSVITEQFLRAVQKTLKQFKAEVKTQPGNTAALLENCIADAENERRVMSDSNSLSQEKDDIFAMRISALEKYLISARENPSSPFEAVKAAFTKDVDRFNKDTAALKKSLSNVFDFCDKAFGADGQELLILVTEIAANTYTSRFVAEKGCAEYYAHDKEMLFHERNMEIISELEQLGLSDTD